MKNRFVSQMSISSFFFCGKCFNLLFVANMVVRYLATLRVSLMRKNCTAERDSMEMNLDKTAFWHWLLGCLLILDLLYLQCSSPLCILLSAMHAFFFSSVSSSLHGKMYQLLLVFWYFLHLFTCTMLLECVFSCILFISIHWHCSWNLKGSLPIYVSELIFMENINKTFKTLRFIRNLLFLHATLINCKPHAVYVMVWI